MKLRSFLAVMVLTLTALSPLPAQYDYGPQPTFTFGGGGIPNDWVVTNSDAGSLGVTLGLSASHRCGSVDCGPVLTHNASNTFFAQPGVSNNPPSPTDQYSLWNVNLAIVGDNVANNNYKFFYDFNPAVGNTDFGNLIIAPVPFENSWNLGMDFLSPPSVFPGAIFPPDFGPFNAFASGEYHFMLVAYDNVPGEFNEVSRTEMFVRVGDVPTETVPEPATMTLLATGLAGMAAAKKRRKKGDSKP